MEVGFILQYFNGWNTARRFGAMESLSLYVLMGDVGVQLFMMKHLCALFCPVRRQLKESKRGLCFYLPRDMICIVELRSSNDSGFARES